MKILLVYTNRNRYMSPPPVGLTFLISPLKDAGHEVRLLDLMFAKNPSQDLETAIDTFRPELVGFSIRNLDNQFMLNLKNPLPEIKEFVSIAKNKEVVTVLGGPAFTTFPGPMLQFMGADYGIAGQGEISLPLLIEALINHKTKINIPGLICRDGGRIIENPPVVTGYAGNQKADWSLVNMKLYKKKALLTPAATVVVKTGCPYECSFCDARITSGNKFILRDIDRIIEDIKTLKELHKVRWFFLNGICFNSPLDFAKELLRRIIAENLKIRFMTRLYPIRNCYDDEFFELYRKAGGYFSMIDFNSFSDKMLESYKKPFNVTDIYDFGRMANKHGLKFGVELLFGGPGETEETIKESMAFLPKINYSLLNYTIGVRISSQTAIYEIARNEGLIKSSAELLFSKFYVSKNIDIDWAKKYIGQAIKKHLYRYRKLPLMILQNVLERF